MSEQSFDFRVQVSVTRTQGKIASRDDILSELQQSLDDANPQSFTANEAEMEVTNWQIDDESISRKQTRRLARIENARQQLIEAVVEAAGRLDGAYAHPKILGALRRLQRLVNPKTRQQRPTNLS